MDETLRNARIDRMMRLQADHPEFCWADLVAGAMGLGTHPGWMADARGQGAYCQADADNMGSCYCGQHVRKEPANASTAG